MSRSSDTDRGLVEPTAALAAVFAVCVATTLYAGVLGDAVTTTDRDLGDPTLTRVHDAVSDRGVVDVGGLSRAANAAPRGHRLNVTLRADGQRWGYGPDAPPATRESGDRASRRVSVRRGPGDVVVGRLAVVVWS
jgi:hypothetical protein